MNSTDDVNAVAWVFDVPREKNVRAMEGPTSGIGRTASVGRESSEGCGFGLRPRFPELEADAAGQGGVGGHGHLGAAVPPHLGVDGAEVGDGVDLDLGGDGGADVVR
ncbi:hypothetical protein HFP72_27425 [Nocardiopsis sp. ARC36]